MGTPPGTKRCIFICRRVGPVSFAAFGAEAKLARCRRMEIKFSGLKTSVMRHELLKERDEEEKQAAHPEWSVRFGQMMTEIVDVGIPRHLYSAVITDFADLAIALHPPFGRSITHRKAIKVRTGTATSTSHCNDAISRQVAWSSIRF